MLLVSLSILLGLLLGLLGFGMAKAKRRARRLAQSWVSSETQGWDEVKVRLSTFDSTLSSGLGWALALSREEDWFWFQTRCLIKHLVEGLNQSWASSEAHREVRFNQPWDQMEAALAACKISMSKSRFFNGSL